MKGQDLSLEKSRLRQTAAETVRRLSPAALKEWSARITERVLASSSYRQAASIFIYVSTEREPDTRALIENAWQAGKAVYVPKCRGQGRMVAAAAASWQDLAPGAMGILEPVHVPADSPFSRIDLAIVPCVCASRNRQRLGHGAGYYDRFLSAHPMPCMCLCFHALLLDSLPAGPLDVPMDAVITDQAAFI